MKILILGDIVGSPGRNAIKQNIAGIVSEHKILCVIANAENAAGGSGITPKIADELFSMGINVITSGDHIWKKKELEQAIDKYPYLLRPLNFPKMVPGNGSCVYETKNIKIGVISLIGRVFMNNLLECPFTRVREEIDILKKQTNIILVDFHAEATSEKVAMGWYLDGYASCVFGTHTHVQTADQRVLQSGTAYITDLGMTGSIDSVIGRKPSHIIQRYLTAMPVRFELATENVQLQGIIVDINEKTGKANNIERFVKKV